jgi:phosphatidylglycerophosphate synthase
MKIAIWILLIQAILGATDTLYYHEYKLQLAHGDHTQTELKLHAVRDFCYAIIIGSLGFATWNGVLAWILFAILLAEIVITLWDFVEEDKVRKLPAGERCMHAVMGIVYGAFLAYLLPEMLKWKNLPTGWGPSYHGFPAWILLLLATGVFVSGIRDLIASLRPSNGAR